MNNQQMMELTTVEKSEFEQLVSECTRSGSIDSNLYIEYDVKRGLRDSNGNGVLTGLTEISDVCGCHSVNGRKIPVDGELYFQGYNVEDIIKGSSRDRFRFEVRCRMISSLKAFLESLRIYRNFPVRLSVMLS